MKDITSRFWSKVNKGPGCWEWTASTNGSYGRFGIGYDNMYAHRVSWMLKHGTVPEDKCVCHICDNGLCVRPSHLFLGTQKDNMKDAIRKKRTAKGKRNGNSILIKEQVIKIRKDTRPQRTIALEYGICQTTVGLIKRKITWKHV